MGSRLATTAPGLAKDGTPRCRPIGVDPSDGAAVKVDAAFDAYSARGTDNPQATATGYYGGLRSGPADVNGDCPATSSRYRIDRFLVGLIVDVRGHDVGAFGREPR